jgi:hypothetical protein
MSRPDFPFIKTRDPSQYDFRNQIPKKSLARPQLNNLADEFFVIQSLADSDLVQNTIKGDRYQECKLPHRHHSGL